MAVVRQLVDLKPRVLRRERLSDQIFSVVLESIRSGDYGPDDLITEPVLAAQLSVSRTPIREALFRLVGNGILTERGHGYCLPVLSAADVKRMFDVRLLLEADILRLISSKDNVGDLSALVTCSEEEGAAIEAGEGRAFVAANTRFRRALFSLCDNQFLTMAADHCNDRMQAYRTVTLADPDNQARVATDHRSLVEAMSLGDMPRATAIYLGTLKKAQAAYSAVASGHLSAATTS
jgi:DNA-binding GntR family transcriptional regulator